MSRGFSLPIVREWQTHPPVSRRNDDSCCGTHYPSLSYLRTLYISPNTTSIRGTNTRLYFAVGSSRVLAYLASVQSPARQAAHHAGCAVADLPNKVEGLVSAGTDLRRREKRLQAELAQWVAKDLWDRAASQAHAGAGASEEEEEEGAAAAPKTITGSLLREEDATNSLEFLSTVALELKQRADTQPNQPQQEKCVFLLASGATSGSPGAAAAGGAVLIFGTDEGAVAAAGKGVVEQFGKERIKGGGKGRWQGKVTGRWEKGDELLLEQIVVAAATAAAAAGGK